MTKNSKESNQTSESLVTVSSSRIKKSKSEASLTTKIVVAPVSAYYSAITAVEKATNKSIVKRTKFEALLDSTFS